jgi:hypothetical protein
MPQYNCLYYYTLYYTLYYPSVARYQSASLVILKETEYPSITEYIGN